MNLFKFVLKNEKKILVVRFLSIPIIICKYNSRLFYKLINYRRNILLKHKLNKLKNKKKIKVGFLVSESAKWTYQSVYEEFANDDRFEVVVLVTKLWFEHANVNNYRQKMEEVIKFFTDKGLNVQVAYDESKHKYLDLKKLGIDILFYQQPWQIDYIQSLSHIMTQIITCYCSYGVGLADDINNCLEKFHRLLDFYFVVSDEKLKILNHRFSNVNNCFVVGYPKLDWYIQNKFIKKSDKKTNKKIIIYAPHHSFEKGSLEMATFQYNGMDILKFAKNNSDNFYWVFKPHPRFKHAVIMNNIMTEQEIDDYYKEWKKIGDIYEGGDYFGIFQQSGAMITDCCSFLGEYLPSGHPLFHLKNPHAKLNSIGERISSAYYVCNNFAEFEQLFTRVITDKDDYKQNERNMCIKQIFDPNQKVSAKIVEKIKDLIDKGK